MPRIDLARIFLVLHERDTGDKPRPHLCLLSLPCRTLYQSSRDTTEARLLAVWATPLALWFFLPAPELPQNGVDLSAVLAGEAMRIITKALGPYLHLSLIHISEPTRPS